MLEFLDRGVILRSRLSSITEYYIIIVCVASCELVLRCVSQHLERVGSRDICLNASKPSEHPPNNGKHCQNV